jgi:hypothetical protein
MTKLPQATVDAIIHYSDYRARWYIELNINGVRVYDDSYDPDAAIIAHRLSEMKLPLKVHPRDEARFARAIASVE